MKIYVDIHFKDGSSWGSLKGSLDDLRRSAPSNFIEVPERNGRRYISLDLVKEIYERYEDLSASEQMAPMMVQR